SDFGSFDDSTSLSSLSEAPFWELKKPARSRSSRSPTAICSIGAWQDRVSCWIMWPSRSTTLTSQPLPCGTPGSASRVRICVTKCKSRSTSGSSATCGRFQRHHVASRSRSFSSHPESKAECPACWTVDKFDHAVDRVHANYLVNHTEVVRPQQALLARPWK